MMNIDQLSETSLKLQVKKQKKMSNDNDDDEPLLNNQDEDEQLIAPENNQPPRVEAVFVVTFDVKNGNVLEFQMPEQEQIRLNGIEYKAIPSGSHCINEDFVYFRYANKYGLACITRVDVVRSNDGSEVDQSQRGMRIKSVGVLTSSIINIQSYLDLLQTESRRYVNESPVNYQRLIEFLERHEQSIPVPVSIHDNIFDGFVRKFGSFIFTLSRLILLRKRVLLYSRSPIGPLCNAVYFTHMISQSVNPLFFVTLTDLPLLNNEQSYIACTTEIIFKEKAQMYDAFIDCNNQIECHTNDPVLKLIMKPTSNDRDRLTQTMTLNSFVNIGNHLYRLMDRLSKSTVNHKVTTEHFHAVGLHPRYDRLFLNEYIRINHIPNVTIGIASSIPFPVSPCCHCPSTN